MSGGVVKNCITLGIFSFTHVIIFRKPVGREKIFSMSWKIIKLSRLVLSSFLCFISILWIIVNHRLAENQRLCCSAKIWWQFSHGKQGQSCSVAMEWLSDGLGVFLRPRWPERIWVELKENWNLYDEYRKIPIKSPGLIDILKHILRDSYSGGLCTGGLYSGFFMVWYLNIQLTLSISNTLYLEPLSILT